jgi:hypothetical protein
VAYSFTVYSQFSHLCQLITISIRVGKGNEKTIVLLFADKSAKPPARRGQISLASPLKFCEDKFKVLKTEVEGVELENKRKYKLWNDNENR